jgi:hypothetical protein
MKTDRHLKSILLLIALLLFVIAARPYLGPQRVVGQSSEGNDFYIEPGTFMLRAPGGNGQGYGRVVVDLKTGDVWGFPTITPDPYPTDATKSQPPVSEPFYLGKFNFAAARR